jgi:WD40 repeat protein
MIIVGFMLHLIRIRGGVYINSVPKRVVMVWPWTKMVGLLINSDILKPTDCLTGARLALCTAAHDGVHFLRIYDVHRKNGQRAVQEVQLDSFYPNFPRPTAREGEVTAVSFSPDGLLLAVARSDDAVHVYDSRFMGQGLEPLRRFLHWGDNCCMAGDEWGVVDAVWVDGWCGRGLGIVTGGSDGEFSSLTSPPYSFLFLVYAKRLRSFLGCPPIGR